jgi:dTMP kinase
LQPDLTILLESDPAMSVGRARRRNRRAARGAGHTSGDHGSGDHASHKSAGKHPDENRFEQQNRAFFARVREGYQAIAAREPQRVVAVDASGTPGQTHGRIVEVIVRKLKLAARNT